MEYVHKLVIDPMSVKYKYTPSTGGTVTYSTTSPVFTRTETITYNNKTYFSMNVIPSLFFYTSISLYGVLTGKVGPVFSPNIKLSTDYTCSQKLYSRITYDLTMRAQIDPITLSLSDLPYIGDYLTFLDDTFTLEIDIGGLLPVYFDVDLKNDASLVNFCFGQTVKINSFMKKSEGKTDFNFDRGLINTVPFLNQNELASFSSNWKTEEIFTGLLFAVKSSSNSSIQIVPQLENPGDYILYTFFDENTTVNYLESSDLSNNFPIPDFNFDIVCLDVNGCSNIDLWQAPYVEVIEDGLYDIVLQENVFHILFSPPPSVSRFFFTVENKDSDTEIWFKSQRGYDFRYIPWSAEESLYSNTFPKLKETSFLVNRNRATTLFSTFFIKKDISAYSEFTLRLDYIIDLSESSEFHSYSLGATNRIIFSHDIGINTTVVMNVDSDSGPCQLITNPSIQADVTLNLATIVVNPGNQLILTNIEDRYFYVNSPSSSLDICSFNIQIYGTVELDLLEKKVLNLKKSGNYLFTVDLSKVSSNLGFELVTTAPKNSVSITAYSNSFTNPDSILSTQFGKSSMSYVVQPNDRILYFYVKVSQDLVNYNGSFDVSLRNLEEFSGKISSSSSQQDLVQGNAFIIIEIFNQQFNFDERLFYPGNSIVSDFVSSFSSPNPSFIKFLN